jgi:hypothetical protein
VAVGEIQVDRRGPQTIVAEDLLDGREGDPLLERQGRPDMSEHGRGDLASELGAVRDPFDNLLGLTCADEPGVVQGEVRLQDGANPRGIRDDPSFAPRAVGGRPCP